MAPSFYFKRANMPKTCRNVLVNSRRTTEIAEAFDIPQPQVSRPVAHAQEKWQQLRERENLVLRMVVLSPQAMAVVTELESQFIEPLKRKKRSPKKDKKRAVKFS